MYSFWLPKNGKMKIRKEKITKMQGGTSLMSKIKMFPLLKVTAIFGEEEIILHNPS